MEKKEFIKTINISLVEDPNSVEFGNYGHYPFSMISEVNGKLTVTALALGEVTPVYEKFVEHLFMNTPEKAFLSIDFPPLMDVDDDFVAIHELHQAGELVETCILPYNKKTGEVKELLTDSIAGKMVHNQFVNAVSSMTNHLLSAIKDEITSRKGLDDDDISSLTKES